MGLRLPAALSLGVGPGSAGRSVRQFVEMTRHSLHRQSIHSQEMLGQLLQEVCMWYPCLAWLSCPCLLGGLSLNSLTLLPVALLQGASERNGAVTTLS